MRRGAKDLRWAVREVGRWLDPAGRGVWATSPPAWDAEAWALLADVAFTQGVAAWLHRSLADAPDLGLSRVLLNRLAAEHAATAARARRVHGDLERILGVAAEAGVAVMPLKGALLTTLGYIDPAVRPMADLDLLIRHGDRGPMLDALRAMGYQPAPGYRTPGRDELVDPRGGSVVSWTSEHPDNPCPVELLRRVEKRPWGGRTVYDLTESLWAEAVPIEILGRPAWRPSDRTLLIHLSAHAAMNLVAGTGRLVQFVDLAVVAPRVSALGDVPVPRLVQTALVIAGRLMPSLIPTHHAVGLAPRVPLGLRWWSSTVPLDTRAGLSDGVPTSRRSEAARLWSRWRPVPWRLWAGYEDRSLPGAALCHARAFRKQMRYRRSHPGRRPGGRRRTGPP